MTRLGLCLSAAVLFCVCSAQDQELENIALGAKYTLTSPNYHLCTDPGDATQLTDGIYSEGYFWAQQSTVGWTGGDPKYITLDLGEDLPICGLSFNTAAGVAEVKWPASIIIFISSDGQNWHELGDLMQMIPRDLLPEYGTYAVRKLTTTGLKAHGRYVQLVVFPGGHYCFVDEIEVYRGPEEFLSVALPGEPMTDVAAYMAASRATRLVKEQLSRDLQAVMDDIEALEEEKRDTLRVEARELAVRIDDLPHITMEGFRAVLPMLPLERDIFALQASVWRAQSKPKLRIWQNHRWDYLAPSDEPGEGSTTPGVASRMMNGEVRADVLNFSNASEEDLTLRLRIEGLPGGTNPDYVKVREVLHVGTRRFFSVAAALPDARREGDDYLVTVPSGMTVQAWIEFCPEQLAAGRHTGAVVVAQPEGTVRVPLQLIISPLRFPEETTLLVGGWCYTDGTGRYGITPENRLVFIDYLKDHCVNAPWATGEAMPEGAYDNAGNLTTKPDTTRFDEWVERWRGAKMYMVFLARADSFAGASMDSEQFGVRLGNWVHFWADHMRELGLKPGQLGLLVYDEPHDAKGYAITEQWAKAIHAAEPDIKIFVDPIPAQPEGMESMMESVDILCPQRQHWMIYDWVPKVYSEQQAKGRTLWFYSCSGPARSFDPFSYYLLQEWHCFKVDAKGSAFWAFGDTSGVSVWNEYTTDGPGPYSPLYLDATSVTTGKWMEAVREGAQDYEYLVMLQRRLAELAAQGKAGEEKVKKAQALLDGAVDRAMAGEEGPNWRWDAVKGRSVADRVREDLLDALENL